MMRAALVFVLIALALHTRHVDAGCGITTLRGITSIVSHVRGGHFGPGWLRRPTLRRGTNEQRPHVRRHDPQAYRHHAAPCSPSWTPPATAPDRHRVARHEGGAVRARAQGGNPGVTCRRRWPPYVAWAASGGGAGRGVNVTSGPRRWAPDMRAPRVTHPTDQSRVNNRGAQETIDMEVLSHSTPRGEAAPQHRDPGLDVDPDEWAILQKLQPKTTCEVLTPAVLDHLRDQARGDVGRIAQIARIRVALGYGVHSHRRAPAPRRAHRRAPARRATRAPVSSTAGSGSEGPPPSDDPAPSPRRESAAARTDGAS